MNSPNTIGKYLTPCQFTVVHSPLHKRWLVLHPERPELVLASGITREKAEQNLINTLQDRT